MSHDAKVLAPDPQASGPGMSYQAAAEFIFDFERKHDLLKFQFDGWCTWALLRYTAQLHLQKLHRSNTLGQPRGQRLITAALTLPKLCCLPAASYLFWTASTARCELVNGRYEDVFFDELLLDASDYFKLEAVNNAEFYERRHNALVKSDLATTPLDLVVSILMRTRSIPGLKAAASEIACELAREPRFNLFSEAFIAQALRIFYWNKRVMLWLLKKLRAKQAIILDAVYKPGLLCAARELGIQTFDQQHGINDRAHCQYVWTDYAKSFKSRLPLPDKLLLYGQFWKEELQHHDFWSDAELIVTGSLRIDRYRRRKAELQRDRPKKSVVITTQGIDRNGLLRFLADLARAIGNSPDVELIVKLHPGFDVSPTPYLQLTQYNCVRLVAGNEPPSTFELLINASCHASISSACHFEAIGLGTPTVVLKLHTHEAMHPLIERGDALLIDSAEEFLSKLRSNGFQPKNNTSDTFYFRPNAAKLFRDAIQLPMATTR